MVALVCPDLLEDGRLPRLGSRGPVVYAALAAGEGAKEFLAARLLAALADLAPEWAEASDWGPPILDTGPLGQPLLYLGVKLGPGLSFSEAGGLVWGALTGQGQVGVDAALEGDFAPPYPYSQAFLPKEWDWAWRLAQGRSASAAALLWAVKEATVKALQVGFHRVDPRDLEVEPPSPHQDGLSLTVRAGVAVPAWARPLKNGWLALAVS